MKQFADVLTLTYKKAVFINVTVTPYIINNEAAFYRMLMKANGNQPLFSQKTTMERAGVKDLEQELEESNVEMEKKAGNELL
ncbi:hypothetical protein [Chryseobacterium cucumeris]|uniref:hypothetical protein n=1 Tax=Chryseobacterium cucumeris TaxID=1813611 RepID=UPI00138F840E|nr:hypothetical protein [Chryseobacterium cucumeris]